MRLSKALQALTTIGAIIILGEFLARSKPLYSYVNQRKSFLHQRDSLPQYGREDFDTILQSRSMAVASTDGNPSSYTFTAPGMRADKANMRVKKYRAAGSGRIALRITRDHAISDIAALYNTPILPFRIPTTI